MKTGKRSSVAIVGCGYVANAHIVAWRRVKGAKLVACCDINEKVAETTAKRWGIPKYYVDFQEPLRKERPSIVDICTPPQTHKTLAVQAMEAGCHVLLRAQILHLSTTCTLLLF